MWRPSTSRRFGLADEIQGENIDRIHQRRVAEAAKRRVPRILWKYCGVQSVPILRNLELKVTRPDEFNDPFEWSPGIAGAVTAEDVAQFYDDPDWVRYWDPPTLSDEREARLRDYAIGARELSETSRAIMAEELHRISRKFGIVCLSKNPASILMWSHYAQNHRGFAVGIDHRKLGKLPLFPVSYARRRVIFSALTPLKIKPDVRTFEIFTRKSPEWAYEQEYRMIWPLSELIPRKIGETDAYVIPLSPEAISEVRLGYRTTPDLEREIRQALVQTGANALLTRVTLHPRRYRLDFTSADASR